MTRREVCAHAERPWSLVVGARAPGALLALGGRQESTVASWTVDVLRGFAHLRLLCLEIARVAWEAERRCQTVFWQGPGSKAPGLGGDQGPAALEGHQCFLYAPNSSSVPFCFPPASVAKAAAPAINICFFQRNKVSFYFMLLSRACLFSLSVGQQTAPPVGRGRKCGWKPGHTAWWIYRIDPTYPTSTANWSAGAQPESLVTRKCTVVGVAWCSDVCL